MAWYWIVLIVLAGLVALTFLVYYFDLDMKLVYRILPVLNKHYEKQKRPLKF